MNSIPAIPVLVHLGASLRPLDLGTSDFGRGMMAGRKIATTLCIRVVLKSLTQEERKEALKMLRESIQLLRRIEERRTK